MESVLIISIIDMYFITKWYNKESYFETFFVDIIVQLFHIIILIFILYSAITCGSTTIKYFLPLNIYTIIKNIYWFIANIGGYITDKDEEITDDVDESNETDDNIKNKDDNQSKKER